MDSFLFLSAEGYGSKLKYEWLRDNYVGNRVFRQDRVLSNEHMENPHAKEALRYDELVFMPSSSNKQFNYAYKQDLVSDLDKFSCRELLSPKFLPRVVTSIFERDTLIFLEGESCSVVCKPRSSSGSKAVSIVKVGDITVQMLSDYSVIYQQYISGIEIVVDICMNKNELRYAERITVERSNGRDTVVSKVPENGPLTELIHDMVAEFESSMNDETGAFNIQAIYNPESKSLKMIEIDSRLSGSMTCYKSSNDLLEFYCEKIKIPSSYLFGSTRKISKISGEFSPKYHNKLGLSIKEL